MGRIDTPLQILDCLLNGPAQTSHIPLFIGRRLEYVAHSGAVFNGSSHPGRVTGKRVQEKVQNRSHPDEGWDDKQARTESLRRYLRLCCWRRCGAFSMSVYSVAVVTV
jgi:hypothetical protein